MLKISASPPIQSAVNLHRGAWGLCLCLNLPEAFSPRKLWTPPAYYVLPLGLLQVFTIYIHILDLHIPRKLWTPPAYKSNMSFLSGYSRHSHLDFRFTHLHLLVYPSCQVYTRDIFAWRWTGRCYTFCAKNRPQQRLYKVCTNI